jgi:AcrR family transcriptional regulator
MLHCERLFASESATRYLTVQPVQSSRHLQVAAMVEAQGVLGPARDRILEAAERVVADVGAARLTLDLVAQAAGVSKGGLLYHFPSKESLLSALAHRYVESMNHCIDSAKCGIGEGESARELKACVLGILGTDRRSKAMGSALLAAAANDPALVEVIRNRIAAHTDELIAANANFARAAIVTLAVDGLKLRELLRISSFTDEQREQIVKELLKIADEAYR